MSLFQLGAVTLHSGAQSDFKIDCNALTDADIECLAWMIAQRVPMFQTVDGVPTGGLRLEKALAKYLVPSIKACYLIVDDVLTTGNSMNELRQNVAARTRVRSFAHNIDIHGAVIFARGPVPDWITPLFRLEQADRLEGRCVGARNAPQG